MSQTTYILSQLSGMDAPQFVQVLGGVYEYSPWVAEQAATQRPLASAEAPVIAMCNVADAVGIKPQLKPVHAYPELTGRAVVCGELTVESTREQDGAGLNQYSPEEFARLQALNVQYNEKFGFPLILAARSYDRHGVIDNFSERVENDHDIELCVSLEQIHRITGFRLADLIAAN